MLFFLDEFAGYFIETDDRRRINLNRYDFKYHPDKKQFKPGYFFEYERTLSQFYGCRMVGLVFMKWEYKGILFSRYTHLFYVFINNYYLKGEPELDKRNFRLDLTKSKIEQAKSVQFHKITPRFERKTVKYVKIIGRTRMYLTMNPFETHRMVFPNGEENGDGEIVAQKSLNTFIHKCIHQIFLISGITFCFETSVSVRV